MAQFFCIVFSLFFINSTVFSQKIDSANLTFRQTITSHNMSFDDAVTDEFLDAELAKLGPCLGRNIHKVSKLLFHMQKIDNKEQVMSSVITKETIANSIALYLELQDDVDHDFVEDEKRQNRYNSENMILQKQDHGESQRLQDEHFIQQHLKQVLSSQYNSDPIAILKAQSRLDIMMSCMSNQQVELLSKVMEEAAIRRQR